MALGTSLLLIAVGAILRFAVADAVPEVKRPDVGLILLIVGAVGMLISLFTMSLWSRDRGGGVVAERRVVERDPYA
jgi:fluoride ion exporter CrcB/FEX